MVQLNKVARLDMTMGKANGLEARVESIGVIGKPGYHKLRKALLDFLDQTTGSVDSTRKLDESAIAGCIEEWLQGDCGISIFSQRDGDWTHDIPRREVMTSLPGIVMKWIRTRKTTSPKTPQAVKKSTGRTTLWDPDPSESERRPKARTTDPPRSKGKGRASDEDQPGPCRSNRDLMIRPETPDQPTIIDLEDESAPELRREPSYAFSTASEATAVSGADDDGLHDLSVLLTPRGTKRKRMEDIEKEQTITDERDGQTDQSEDEDEDENTRSVLEPSGGASPSKRARFDASVEPRMPAERSPICVTLTTEASDSLTTGSRPALCNDSQETMEKPQTSDVSTTESASHQVADPSPAIRNLTTISGSTPEFSTLRLAKEVMTTRSPRPDLSSTTNELPQTPLRPQPVSIPHQLPTPQSATVPAIRRSPHKSVNFWPSMLLHMIEQRQEMARQERDDTDVENHTVWGIKQGMVEAMDIFHADVVRVAAALETR